MRNFKSFGDSLLSAFLIIAWIVILFKIFELFNTENAIDKFIWTWRIAVSVGIIGGMTMHLYILLKHGTFRCNFIYNFFGTLNIMVGSLAMGFHPASGQPVSYLGVACFAIGIIMYRNIYRGYKHVTPME
jgi:hypothetical protein